jgi:peptide/nickel transport system permease protein
MKRSDTQPLPASRMRRTVWPLHKLAKPLASASIGGWVGSFIIFAYAVIIVCAPFIAPYGETQIVSDVSYAPASAQEWLGSDQLGRDMLTRIIYGIRNSVSIALVTCTLAFLIGAGFGSLSSILRGTTDDILSGVCDIIMSVPQLIFALILLSIFDTSTINLIAIIAILDSTRIYRVTRAVAINVAASEFVEVARLRGEGTLWLMGKEIFPNIFPTLLAEFGIRFNFVFLTISSLSFLGLGIQPPIADLGSMVRENAALITYGNITPLLPAAAIALLTLGVNFIVDWPLQISSLGSGSN